jgi:hypothetical protein
VISVTENSSKSQKNRFWKEKSVEDMVILGPMAQAALVWMKQRKSWLHFASNREDWKLTKCGSTKVGFVQIITALDSFCRFSINSTGLRTSVFFNLLFIIYIFIYYLSF